jgi:hypothetical protein
VRFTVVVGARLPEVPVTVIDADPVAAELLIVKFIVLCEVVLAGVNVAVTPFGRLEVVKLTLPEKPCAGTTLTAIEPLAACCRITVLGDDKSVKLGVWRKLDPWPPAPQPVVIARTERIAMVPNRLG